MTFNFNNFCHLFVLYCVSALCQVLRMYIYSIQNSLHIGAIYVIINRFYLNFSTNMLLLALSSLYYFNYTIWDIVIPGIFT